MRLEHCLSDNREESDKRNKKRCCLSDNREESDNRNKKATVSKRRPLFLTEATIVIRISSGRIIPTYPDRYAS